MTENELIGEIRKLRQIKPNKDWVVLTKDRIIGEADRERVSITSFFPVLRPVYVGLVFVFIIFGVFGISQNALPGDLLYPIKKITERSQAIFISEGELPKVQLELVSKRLEELNQITQKNDVKKIAPAIQEFQANLSVAAGNLTKTKNSDVSEIVSEIKKIKETKENIESSLATKFGDDEIRDLDSASLQLIEREIKYLEGRTLTDPQKELLIQAKKDLESGDYEDALLKIYSISNRQ